MTAAALEVVDVPVGDLHPHPRNPRKITKGRLEHLMRTLAAEPDMLRARPLIALLDGTVVAGNQRLAAAIELGWETIPVMYAHLTPEQETRWMLLDNRPFGEDDEAAVAVLLAELDQASEADLDLTGKSESVALLLEIRPYLVVKGEQADIFLAAANRDYLNGRRVTESELAARRAIVASMEAARTALRADYTNQPEYAP